MTTIRRQRFKHIIGRTVLLIFGMFLAAFGIGVLPWDLSQIVLTTLS